MNKKIIPLLLLVLVLVTATTCAQIETQSPVIGQEPIIGGTNSAAPPSTQLQPGSLVVKIADILTQPENFTENMVIIEGKIVSQCGAGCWFTINDGTGTIYVDLAPSNLTIPQKRGAFARVYGRVVKKGSDTYLIGERVEF